MLPQKLVIQLITTEEDLSKMIEGIIEKKWANLSPPNSPATKEETEDELLTIKQLAQFYQVSETSIHAWKNEGILPYVKIKSRIRFKKSEVLKLYEKRKKNFK